MSALLPPDSRQDLPPPHAPADLAAAAGPALQALLAAAEPPSPAQQRAQRFAAWLETVQRRPEAYDLWQLLRHIDASHPDLPRLGLASRPSDEPVRLTQPADFRFAPGSVRRVATLPGGGLRVDQPVFGLLGPNGPLPLHMTELVHERRLHQGDHTLQAFLDMLGHRFTLLFYRAWAQAQPVVHLDRGTAQAPLARWVGSLFGLGSEPLQERDAAGDAAKLQFSNRLSRQVRDANGLQCWCRAQFDVPLQIQQWCGHWMPLGRDEQTRLRRRDGQGLGRGAVIGRSVWDVQHKFRIVIGPLPLARYLAFLPGGQALARLQAMVRQWVGLEFSWDLQLILARPEVPQLRLGTPGVKGPGSNRARPDAASPPIAGALGRAAWLGRYRAERDCDALVIDVERTLRTRRRPPPAPSATASAATV